MVIFNSYVSSPEGNLRYPTYWSKCRKRYQCGPCEAGNAAPYLPNYQEGKWPPSSHPAYHLSIIRLTQSSCLRCCWSDYNRWYELYVFLFPCHRYLISASQPWSILWSPAHRKTSRIFGRGINAFNFPSLVVLRSFHWIISQCISSWCSYIWTNLKRSPVGLPSTLFPQDSRMLYLNDPMIPQMTQQLSQLSQHFILYKMLVRKISPLSPSYPKVCRVSIAMFDHQRASNRTANWL